MHRITKLVLALAAITLALLAVSTLEYASIEQEPSASLPLGQDRLPATIPAAAPTVAAPGAPTLLPVSPPAIAPAIGPPAVPTTVRYVVQPHDTLWDLAAAHLGNPLRWQELYDLNRMRIEPGGQSLANSDLIYPGWTLEFPTDAEGLRAPQAPAAASGRGSA